MRIPTRKIRPAAQTRKTVVTSAIAAASRLCQAGTPGGIETRAVMTIGAEHGKNEIAVASGPDGSWMMFPSTNIGSMTSSITGMIIDCASLMFVTAAPAATNIEPYIIVPRIVKNRNHRIDAVEMYDAMPCVTA